MQHWTIHPGTGKHFSIYLVQLPCTELTVCWGGWDQLPPYQQKEDASCF